jgi:deazaflavin-dependent oxidoreductase (nitroreductase family)
VTAPGRTRSRPSPVNRVVLAVLRSPLHRMLSRGVLELKVRGRRTGRLITLPVQYARHGDRLVVLPGHAGRKTWWRNLTGGAEVSVRLGGVARHGRAEILYAGTPAFQAALGDYLRRFPRARPVVSSSPVLVAVTLAPAGLSPPRTPGGGGGAG